MYNKFTHEIITYGVGFFTVRSLLFELTYDSGWKRNKVLFVQSKFNYKHCGLRSGLKLRLLKL